ncbi:hypothetical protein DJ568_02155 [Mucilaginibacter hurinus]|uniref:DUF962 domain-containing protein n=1 Tax=Mucilaginibacter hurinus TaxID=2201324 RepID=A0A367GV67_9SPHI|nr:Mpo1-like protein [Mucilaginibacter hurinus]RCH56681.1 hypothetical protein DJ568_02155 [Mucilaginibacter hurinus]
MVKNKIPGKHQPLKQQRHIDQLFAEYTAYHQHPTNKLLQVIFIPLFILGLFGLVWAIPFPHLKFLGERNDMFNWASVLIGVSIYFYYRLSPVISYFILFTLFILSYIITLIQQFQPNGSALWQVSLLILIIGVTGIWLGYAAEKKNPGFGVRLKHIFIAPAYLWHIVLNKFSVKY